MRISSQRSSLLLVSSFVIQFFKDFIQLCLEATRLINRVDLNVLLVRINVYLVFLGIEQGHYLWIRLFHALSFYYPEEGLRYISSNNFIKYRGFLVFELQHVEFLQVYFWNRLLYKFDGDFIGHANEFGTGLEKIAGENPFRVNFLEDQTRRAVYAHVDSLRKHVITNFMIICCIFYAKVLEESTKHAYKYILFLICFFILLVLLLKHYFLANKAHVFTHFRREKTLVFSELPNNCIYFLNQLLRLYQRFLVKEIV